MGVRSNVIAPSFGDGQRSKGVGESRVRGGERGRAVGRPNQLIERAIFRSWGIIDSRGAFGGRYQGTSLSSWSSLSSASSASSKKSRYCKWGVYSYGLKLCRTGSKHGGKVTGPGWNWLNLDLDHADTARTEMTDGRHRHSLTHTLAHTHTRRIPNDTQALLRLQHVPSGSDIPPRATHSLLLLRERLRGSSHWAFGTTNSTVGGGSLQQSALAPTTPAALMS
ncbi:hypothetical protein CCHR01_02865 [Colletotrichum chrysophilum]|uniref:Uncharacterized protein n=1 Tax=Colletotrichum chrysophilum TaxID=1836956 RepID=A0AAD9AXH2_9PEZI|nr:hypothetical protein CCHR01_02865 [Colletotrichum chrysophilum]